MIELTREVRFSVDPAGDPAGGGLAFANTWAGWPRSDYLAPFIMLRVTVGGTPNPSSGYLCDIKALDELVHTHAIPVIERLNSSGAIAMGALLRELWQRLPAEAAPGVHVVRIELLCTPYVSYAINRTSPNMIQMTEQFEFAASHRLHCADWSDEQNRRVFGKCNNPNGHGHNYVVDVTVGLDVEDTDYVGPRDWLERIVKEEVLDRFDHKHLNEDTVEFRSLNPTVENITRVVWDLLVNPLRPLKLVAVRVYETPKTWAEYRGRDLQDETR